MKHICKARRINDEMHCGRCGLIWDVKDDNRPKCKPVKYKRNKRIR